MPFVKGDTRINYAGRPKGSLNKDTKLRQEIEDAIRGRLKELKTMPIKDLTKIWASLQPKDMSLSVKPDVEFISNVPRPMIDSSTQGVIDATPDEDKLIAPTEDKKISEDRSPT